MYASLETDVDNFDIFRDISSNDKLLVRVGAKTFVQLGTYMTIKLYTEDEEGTCQLVNSSPWWTFLQNQNIGKSKKTAK